MFDEEDTDSEGIPISVPGRRPKRLSRNVVLDEDTDSEDIPVSVLVGTLGIIAVICQSLLFRIAGCDLCAAVI